MIATCCAAALALYLFAYSKCDTCTDHRATAAVILGVPLALLGVIGLRLIGWEERHK